jgi:RNA polymerase sigma-70 factor, ECF subfamily
VPYGKLMFSGKSLGDSAEVGRMISATLWSARNPALCRPSVEDALTEEPATSDPGPRPAPDRDADLVNALRDGSEVAFIALLDRYYVPMLRVASMYVLPGMAEDIVQEAWLGVLEGIDRFEGRSSLRTWIFRILINVAKTRGRREARSIPFSSLWDPAEARGDPAVDPARFLDASDPQWPHHWASPPHSWGQSPEDLLLSREGRAYIDRAIETLPPSQREVIAFRDIQGWTSKEVCALLGITPANERVLLHRARSRVRGVLERYFDERGPER